MINSKRRGRLILTHDLINENPALVSLLFQKLIPIAAVHTPDDEIVYTAISPEFAEIQHGAVLPLYFVIVKKDEAGQLQLFFERYEDRMHKEKGNEDGPEDTRV